MRSKKYIRPNAQKRTFGRVFFEKCYILAIPLYLHIAIGAVDDSGRDIMFPTVS